ncbi:TIGR03986 family CRISPR-associated RAMP protein [Rhabdaerophilum sp. SD176]|uniref:TIGR03986 family type III CRISPR-associated RAMP protein n=1 Tax=Rhabdaerophilum sp. SD176 TaxID=2983548 RepID=UPI0024DF95CE|nr:TIGR03986 family CRISPR-associated RAMP protein [Rhabdaerophilum sp. SD176]
MNTSSQAQATSDDVHTPYNFVPLSPYVFEPTWAESISHDLPFKDGLSGIISFNVISVTPLLVGGKRKQANNSQPGRVEFCRLPDGDHRYFIPGSSLRGMVRNVLEIASFSRMKAVDNRRFSLRDLSGGMQQLYNRRMEERPDDGFVFRAGWLRYDTNKAIWIITPCEYGRIPANQIGIHNVRKFEHQPVGAKYTAVRKAMNGDGLNSRLEGHFQIVENGKSDVRKLIIVSKDVRGAFPGTVVLTGQPNAEKKKEFVFFNENATKSVAVSAEVMREFRDIHETAAASADPFSAKQRDGGGEEAKSTWDYFKGKERIPVFFHTQNNKVVSLGLARMYKVPARQTIHDLLGQEHLNQAKLDLAEAIFGRIAAPDGATTDTVAFTGLKGRVSFGHAVLASQIIPQAVEQRPAILSTPKPSFAPAYLVQPQGNPATGELKHGASYSSYEDSATLRGWKRYPVRPLAAARTPAPIPPALVDKLTQQVVLKTLPEAMTFSGELRVHNLRPMELGALLWAMTWGGNTALAHALGMGKPFGFGQVRFQLNPEKLQYNLSRADGEKAPSLTELLKTFEDVMEAFIQSKGLKAGDEPIGWKDSDQIMALTAMADPRKAEIIHVNGRAVANGPAGWLESMPLTDFATKKGAKGGKPRFLRPYARQQHSGSLSAKPQAAPTPTNALGQSRPTQAPARAVPVSSGLEITAGTKVYADGELATLLDDVTEEKVRNRTTVRVDYGDDDVLSISAHRIKRA